MRYFAYGPNLDPSVGSFLSGGQAAVLDDWELVMSVPSTEWNGAVGTIDPKPGSVVYGVLFEIPDTAAGPVREREGATAGLAREIQVEARIYVPDAANATIRLELAVAFAASPDRTSATPPAPSQKWLDSVLRGARARALPAEWIAELEGKRK